MILYYVIFNDIIWLCLVRETRETERVITSITQLTLTRSRISQKDENTGSPDLPRV